MPQPGTRFRQDNDFFYLTEGEVGLEGHRHPRPSILSCPGGGSAYVSCSDHRRWILERPRWRLSDGAGLGVSRLACAGASPRGRLCAGGESLRRFASFRRFEASKEDTFPHYRDAV
jgi:hypothetical protein